MNVPEIKELRVANKLTQKQVADYLGVSKAYLSLIESGKKKLPSDMIRKIYEGINALSPKEELDPVVRTKIQQLLIDSEIYSSEYPKYLEDAKELLAKVPDKEEYIKAKLGLILSRLYRYDTEYEKSVFCGELALQYFLIDKDNYILDYFETLLGLAQSYSATKKYLTAESLYARIVQQMERDYPVHMIRFISLLNQTLINSRLGSSDVPFLLQRCKELQPFIEWTGPHAENWKLQFTFGILSLEANMADKEANYALAADKLEQSLELIKETNSIQVEHEIQCLKHAVYVYKKSQNLWKAEKYLIRLTQIHKCHYQHKHPNKYFDSLNQLASFYVETGKYPEALDCIEKVITQDAKYTEQIAFAHRNFGFLLYKRDNNKELYVRYLVKALDVLSASATLQKTVVFAKIALELKVAKQL